MKIKFKAFLNQESKGQMSYFLEFWSEKETEKYRYLKELPVPCDPVFRYFAAPSLSSANYHSVQRGLIPHFNPLFRDPPNLQKIVIPYISYARPSGFLELENMQL